MSSSKYLTANFSPIPEPWLGETEVSPPGGLVPEKQKHNRLFNTNPAVHPNTAASHVFLHVFLLLSRTVIYAQTDAAASAAAEMLRTQARARVYVRACVCTCACGRRKPEQIISLIINTGNKEEKPSTRAHCPHTCALPPHARTHTHTRWRCTPSSPSARMTTMHIAWSLAHNPPSSHARALIFLNLIDRDAADSGLAGG